MSSLAGARDRHVLCHDVIACWCLVTVTPRVSWCHRLQVPLSWIQGRTGRRGLSSSSSLSSSSQPASSPSVPPSTRKNASNQRYESYCIFVFGMRSAHHRQPHPPPAQYSHTDFDRSQPTISSLLCSGYSGEEATRQIGNGLRQAEYHQAWHHRTADTSRSRVPDTTARDKRGMCTHDVTGQITPIVYKGPLWEYQIMYEVTPKMLKMTADHHVDAKFICVTA